MTDTGRNTSTGPREQSKPNHTDYNKEHDMDTGSKASVNPRQQNKPNHTDYNKEQ